MYQQDQEKYLDQMVSALASNCATGQPTNEEMQQKMAAFEKDILADNDIWNLMNLYRITAHGAASGRHQLPTLEPLSEKTEMTTAVAYHLLNHKLRQQINVNYRALKEPTQKYDVFRELEDSLISAREAVNFFAERGQYLYALEARGRVDAFTGLETDFYQAERENNQ